jgi:hypothetical protein
MPPENGHSQTPKVRHAGGELAPVWIPNKIQPARVRLSRASTPGADFAECHQVGEDTADTAITCRQSHGEVAKPIRRPDMPNTLGRGTLALLVDD